MNFFLKIKLQMAT